MASTAVDAEALAAHRETAYARDTEAASPHRATPSSAAHGHPSIHLLEATLCASHASGQPVLCDKSRPSSTTHHLRPIPHSRPPRHLRPAM